MPRWLWMIAALAVLIYLNAIPGDFVFDDKLIQRDPRVLGQTSFWTIFVTDYWYKYIGTSADLYRPLTIASYAINHMLAGMSSPAFHVANIALHALVSVVVVLLVDALFRDRDLSVTSGLLFAAHPLHTEAVTGIVGRAELLSAVFLLWALYLHARSYVLFGWGRALWLPLALIAYLCALLSKETAIVGPGLLVLVEVVRRLDQTPRTGVALKSNLPSRPWLPFFAVLALYVAVAGVYLGIRYQVVGVFLQKPPQKSYLLLFGHPLRTRVLTALTIVMIYARLLTLPVTLSADYSFRQVPLIESLNDAAPLIGLAILIAVGVVFLWAIRRRLLPLAFGIAFFAVAYALVGNLIVPIGVMVAERLMYLPSVGFCIAVAWVGLTGVRRYAPKLPSPWRQRAPSMALTTVLLLYGVRTFVRNMDWRDNEHLYAATVAASPDCHAAHFNYSAILLRDPNKKELALQELLKAYAIRRDHYPSLVNLASVYLDLDQPYRAREIAVEGLKVRPDGRELQGLLAAAEQRLRAQAPGGE